MFRLIFYLLLCVVLISVLRTIIGTIARAFSLFVQAGGANGAAPSGQRRPQVPLTGELKRDPVCGTFIAESSAIRHTEGGRTVHFCSAECRDKYLLAARH